jgi:hypothetical protein
MTPADWCTVALSGALVTNIGQIDSRTARALDRQVRAGNLAKGRGFWTIPMMGPLKTIWGTPAALAASPRVVAITSTPPPATIASSDQE